MLYTSNIGSGNYDFFALNGLRCLLSPTDDSKQSAFQHALVARDKLQRRSGPQAISVSSCNMRFIVRLV